MDTILRVVGWRHDGAKHKQKEEEEEEEEKQVSNLYK